MSNSAEEYLKIIGCFNTVYLKRDKNSNTMAKIMEAYCQAKMEEIVPSDEEIEKEFKYEPTSDGYVGAMWLKQKLLNK